jgi:uncharacterized membrane protein YbhN (UPF0104 family)
MSGGTSPQGHGTSPQGHGTSPQGHGTSPQGHGTSPQGHGTSPQAGAAASEEPGRTRRGTLSRLRAAGQWLVAALVLFFLGRLLARHWAELQTTDWQVDVPLLLGAYGLLALAWLALVANWRWLLGRLGARLDLPAAWRIWFLSNIVRYVPGNIWQYLGMVYLGAQAGVARTTTLASILIYQAASVVAGLVAAGGVYLLAGRPDLLAGLVPGASGQVPWSLSLAGLALALALAALVCYPPLINAALRWVFRLLGREPLQISLTAGDLAQFFLQRLGIWLLQGAAFALFVQSLVPLTWPDAPVVGAAFVLSWVVGFVSLLTPSGLGVREAAQTALLAVVLPVPVAVALALLSRLWLVGGELAGAGIGLLVGRPRGRPAPEAPGA